MHSSLCSELLYALKCTQTDEVIYVDGHFYRPMSQQNWNTDDQRLKSDPSVEMREQTNIWINDSRWGGQDLY